MKGIIAAGSQQTAESGAQMLQIGGNAVDAAVAATFASFMAEAAISSLGGGGFATVHPPGQDPVLYDFFSAMPGLGAKANGPKKMDFAPVTITFEDTTGVYHAGRGSTAVPGNLAGLCTLLDEAGTLPLATVLAPTIRLAREGFTLSKAQAYLISLVDPVLQYAPSSQVIFAPEGRLLAEGEHFANPAFAATLEHIATEGARTLYTGPLGDALLAEHRAHGGLITAEDLATYRVIKREPLRIPYKGYTLYTNTPPSMGGLLIAYALRLFERADLGHLAHGDAGHIALLAEIMRQTIIARHRDDPTALPDADAWAKWLSDANLESDWAQVVTACQDGPPTHTPDDPGTSSSTTHISVMDETGLAIGLTTTPGETGGYAVGDTGMLMNNILGEANINPNGFHQWQAGTRLNSMMAPTIVTDGSGPRLVIGSGGSNRLRGAIFQLLGNVLDWRMPIQEAVDRPRVHFEAHTLDLEAGFNPLAADALDKRGYQLLRWGEKSLYFGGTHVTLRDDDGRFSGAGDTRRGGAVVVVE